MRCRDSLETMKLMRKPARMIQTFNDRYPLVGPAFWISSVQYFITQIVVAHAWTNHYSLSRNTISDLGNTVCGVYSGRFVCSPLHSWMNASFVVLGLTMISGSMLIYHEFRKSPASAVGFSFMALAGLGTVLVGLFSENAAGPFHLIGAALPFFIGNVALVVLGLALDIPRAFRYYTILSGLIALIALLLFYTHTYLGLGQGGMERLTAHPQTVWLIVFGIYMSANHFRRSAKN